MSAMPIDCEAPMRLLSRAQGDDSQRHVGELIKRGEESVVETGSCGGGASVEDWKRYA